MHSQKKHVMANDALYNTLRPLVEYATRCHYASVSIRGAERLPQEGGYIIAPCHQNGMMEPLLIMLLTPGPVYHICRGDIFENPTLARLFDFLKIFPIFRRRDGLKALSRNEDTFNRSRQVLLDGFPLSMMAEGRHNDRHQLLPLVKGMFRIALQTQHQMGDAPLFIVPLGIDLDHYERPYSHAVLNVGEPIDVRPFLTIASNDEPVALNAMRDELTTRLKAVMHNIDSHEHYDEFADLCLLLNREERQRLGINDTPFNRFVARQKIAQRLDALERAAAANPTGSEAAELQQMLALAHERRDYASRHHTSVSRLAEPPSTTARLLRIGAILAAVLLLIPTLTRTILLTLLVCYPLPLLPTHLIVRHTVEDSQFRSSINFGVRLLLSIIYMIALFITVSIIHSILWGMAALTVSLLLATITPKVIDWMRRGL